MYSIQTLIIQFVIDPLFAHSKMFSKFAIYDY